MSAPIPDPSEIFFHGQKCSIRAQQLNLQLMDPRSTSFWAEDLADLQCVQMGRFRAGWVILGDPWVLFHRFYLLLAPFRAKFLMRQKFWAKLINYSEIFWKTLDAFSFKTTGHSGTYCRSITTTNRSVRKSTSAAATDCFISSADVRKSATNLINQTWRSPEFLDGSGAAENDFRGLVFRRQGSKILLEAHKRIPGKIGWLRLGI